MERSYIKNIRLLTNPAGTSVVGSGNSNFIGVHYNPVSNRICTMEHAGYVYRYNLSDASVNIFNLGNNNASNKLYNGATYGNRFYTHNFIIYTPPPLLLKPTMEL